MTVPLMVSRCTGCQRVSWPIRDRCGHCLSETRTVESPSTGKVVAFSQERDGRYFCVADFDDMRLVCTLRAGDIPALGQGVVLLGCRETDSGTAFDIAVRDGAA